MAIEYKEPDKTVSATGSIQFFKGLNITTVDTCYFDSLSIQNRFFEDQKATTIPWVGVASGNEPSYIIKSKFETEFKIPCAADSLFEYDYMRVKNGTNEKWIYYFIKDISYINVGLTKVTASVDVIQTFLFDANLGYQNIDKMSFKYQTSSGSLQYKEKFTDPFVKYNALNYNSEIKYSIPLSTIDDSVYYKRGIYGKPCGMLSRIEPITVGGTDYFSPVVDYNTNAAPTKYLNNPSSFTAEETPVKFYYDDYYPQCGYNFNTSSYTESADSTQILKGYNLLSKYGYLLTVASVPIFDAWFIKDSTGNKIRQNIKFIPAKYNGRNIGKTSKTEDLAYIYVYGDSDEDCRKALNKLIRLYNVKCATLEWDGTITSAKTSHDSDIKSIVKCPYLCSGNYISSLPIWRLNNSHSDMTGSLTWFYNSSTTEWTEDSDSSQDIDVKKTGVCIVSGGITGSNIPDLETTATISGVTQNVGGWIHKGKRKVRISMQNINGAVNDGGCQDFYNGKIKVEFSNQRYNYIDGYYYGIDRPVFNTAGQTVNNAASCFSKIEITDALRTFSLPINIDDFKQPLSDMGDAYVDIMIYGVCNVSPYIVITIESNMQEQVTISGSSLNAKNYSRPMQVIAGFPTIAWYDAYKNNIAQKTYTSNLNTTYDRMGVDAALTSMNDAAGIAQSSAHAIATYNMIPLAQTMLKTWGDMSNHQSLKQETEIRFDNQASIAHTVSGAQESYFQAEMLDNDSHQTYFTSGNDLVINVYSDDHMIDAADDVLSMYGYSYNGQNIYLNSNGLGVKYKPNFTYIKTKNCKVYDSKSYTCVGIYKEQIDQRFDNGMRFWNQLDSITTQEENTTYNWKNLDHNLCKRVLNGNRIFDIVVNS